MASKASRRRRKRRREKATGGAGATREQAPAEPPPEVSAPSRPSRAAARRRAIDEQPPPAPWGSFPLIELTVLVGIVMLILGLLVVGGERGTVLVVTGLALASIGGLEVAVREHLAGYRSHTLVLAGLPAAIVLGLLYWQGPEGLSPLLRIALAAAVFAIAAYLLTRLFQSRSGGYAFRLTGFRRR